MDEQARYQTSPASSNSAMTTVRYQKQEQSKSTRNQGPLRTVLKYAGLVICTPVIGVIGCAALLLSTFVFLQKAPQTLIRSSLIVIPVTWTLAHLFPKLFQTKWESTMKAFEDVLKIFDLHIPKKREHGREQHTFNDSRHQEDFRPEGSNNPSNSWIDTNEHSVDHVSNSRKCQKERQILAELSNPNGAGCHSINMFQYDQVYIKNQPRAFNVSWENFQLKAHNKSHSAPVTPIRTSKASANISRYDTPRFVMHEDENVQRLSAKRGGDDTTIDSDKAKTSPNEFYRPSVGSPYRHLSRRLSRKSMYDEIMTPSKSLQELPGTPAANVDSSVTHFLPSNVYDDRKSRFPSIRQVPATRIPQPRESSRARPVMPLGRLFSASSVSKPVGKKNQQVEPKASSRKECQQNECVDLLYDLQVQSALENDKQKIRRSKGKPPSSGTTLESSSKGVPSSQYSVLQPFNIFAV